MISYQDDLANDIIFGLLCVPFVFIILWWILFIIGTVEQFILYLRKKKSEGTE